MNDMIKMIKLKNIRSGIFNIYKKVNLLRMLYPEIWITRTQSSKIDFCHSNQKDMYTYTVMILS